jgi:hypothetical protein
MISIKCDEIWECPHRELGWGISVSVLALRFLMRVIDVKLCSEAEVGGVR